jgi:hypothetical protein
MAQLVDLGFGFDPDLSSRVRSEVRSAVAGRAAEIRNERHDVLINNLAVAIAERVREVLGS